jgi:CubicO group peptidase (beta-lactamase class C family)
MNGYRGMWFLTVLIVALWCAACQARSNIPFSVETLTQGISVDGPLDNRYLTPPANASLPTHIFEGRLELVGESSHGEMKMIRGSLPSTAKHLPEFDFEFVQEGGDLIPVQRGLILTGHPKWDYILEPGRAWQQSDDNGYSRASFPFALVEKNGNSIYNGVMIFLYDDHQVSKVWYQVTQETSAYFRANFWGMLDAVYHPGNVSAAQQVRQDFARERAGRFPTRPIALLSKYYPGVDASAFGREITPEHMTTYGVVVDGVNYRGGCTTRYGEFPYCESMRVPSFSTAKSAFASVALMRLAYKYGPQVADLLIKDYLPETASSPGDWSQVTFKQVLSMSSGNYGSTAWMADEDGRIASEFFGVASYKDRMASALDWPHSAEPGAVFVYRSSDTFIFTAALQNYLNSREGANTDIFDFVVNEVYRPILMGPGVFSIQRTEETDGSRGLPLGYMGMWWVSDDIAKISTLLNVDHGAAGREQLLQPGLLAAAMQTGPNDHGLNTGKGSLYNEGFWALHYPADEYGCEFYIPYMSGYSGITVAMMPDGVTYYYFSDNQEFEWQEAVSAANQIRPFCNR